MPMVYAKSEGQDVTMFGQSTGLADVEVLVQGTYIPVIKTVLSVASPVFRAMFGDDFKEKDTGEISLPGKKLDDVLTLLKCIYPDILLTITESVAFTVLPLSEEYQMTTLKEKCEESMLQTLHQKFDDFYMKDSVYLYKFLTVSVKYNLKRLEAYCVSLAADFKQQDREIAMEIHGLPVDVVRKVDKLAISRLEIIRDDAYSSKQSDDNLEGNIRSLCRSDLNTFNAYACRSLDYTTKVNKFMEQHFKGLRLAYMFLKSNKDMRKLAVSRIRDDKRSGYWCHDEEYNLLPENIKRDVEDAKL